MLPEFHAETQHPVDEGGAVYASNAAALLTLPPHASRARTISSAALGGLMTAPGAFSAVYRYTCSDARRQLRGIAHII
jgi:hypothetical protein